MRTVTTLAVAVVVTFAGFIVRPGAWAVSATAHPVAIPAGWRTYTYGKAQISVPPTWTLVTGGHCPDHNAQGILALGAPTRLTNCPVGVANVVVAALSPGDAKARAGCPAIRVDGRDAYVLPCRTAGSKDIVQYLVPALGVQAVGSGTAGQNVSGPGETTVVGRVLHTLR
jgi:hypothetical protein